MKHVNPRKRSRRVAAVLALASIGMVGAFTAGSPAVAQEPALELGPNVVADPASPTGYTVTFVYNNPNATQVILAGDLTLLGLDSGNTRFQPEEWQTGRYHSGGVEFRRDMTMDADGNWSVSLPLHAGGISYWYRVWDPTQGWVNKRIWDPTSDHPRPPGEAAFRVGNNDVLDAVYVPYAAQQNDPVLEQRAMYELPAADPANRGSVSYVEYTNVLGEDGGYLGVYLPAGYDPNRAEPYKVVYLAHGFFGDETDFMVPGNVPNILDNMIARGELEPTVAITMGNHFTGDVPFTSYNRANAADNLVQVILPRVEADYNVATESDGRAYGGFSYGGSTGGFVIEKYPTVFGYYGFFSGNPTLTTSDYEFIDEAVEPHDLFVFLGNGVFEGSINSQNAIADQFRARGFGAQTAQVRGAHDMMTAGQLFTIYAKEYLWDADKDGVRDWSDACADSDFTAAPTTGLKPNHYASTADGFVGADGVVAYSLLDVGGCSSTQIIEAAGLGKGHLKFGIARGAIESWIASLGD